MSDGQHSLEGPMGACCAAALAHSAERSTRRLPEIRQAWTWRRSGAAGGFVAIVVAVCDPGGCRRAIGLRMAPVGVQAGDVSSQEAVQWAQAARCGAQKANKRLL
jgi:hypothetical protein